ncbi:glutathione S-transferase family protein [Psychrobium sp. 1_MG-2023]|nr:glutathione S-transferase family protein [Psychrobium sp. 1_MG-2023]MDP2562164.1 glutathione S-transferase family protein [Psychrobium sp. 1_MG-2023]PKF57209.1 glutathione S-transferase [Alteromonadales bacterium alter-6D02]
MYQLYYYPCNASMAPHFMLEALRTKYQIEFELLKVDRKNNAQKSAQYLALNPAGRIPTLIDREQAIFESPAICIHLAEQHPQAKLIPAIGTSERAKFMQWMMYLTNTLQAELMVYFYPEKHSTDVTHAAAIKQAQDQRVSDILALLDNELANSTYLVGDSISACDYFLFMLAVWADEITKPPLEFTHLARYLRQLAKQPEIIKACETEGVSLALYQENKA